MTENEDIRKTQFSSVYIEKEQWELYNKLKEESFDEGCCFKKRIADFFLFGACRAYFQKAFSKKLTKDKDLIHNAFNISPVDSGKKTRTLVDKEDFWNIFRVIAYANKIKETQSKKGSKEWEESHNILINGTECTRIAEDLFKGGSTFPFNDDFMNLASSDFPDDKICEDLGFMEQFIHYFENGV